jgi:hypothetical protein
MSLPHYPKKRNCKFLRGGYLEAKKCTFLILGSATEQFIEMEQNELATRRPCLRPEISPTVKYHPSNRNSTCTSTARAIAFFFHTFLLCVTLPIVRKAKKKKGYTKASNVWLLHEMFACITCTVTVTVTVERFH